MALHLLDWKIPEAAAEEPLLSPLTFLVRDSSGIHLVTHSVKHLQEINRSTIAGFEVSLKKRVYYFILSIHFKTMIILFLSFLFKFLFDLFF